MRLFEHHCGRQALSAPLKLTSCRNWVHVMIRKRALPIALGAGVMLAFFLGCGGDNPTATPPPGTGPIIPPTTKIITDAEAENALLAVGSSGQLLVRGGSSLADRVATGDVLVSGRIPGAPYGLLRLVTAQRDSAGVRIIETAQAALTDAIQSCDVSDSLAFNQSHVDSIWTDEGVTLVPTQSDKGGLETEFAFDLDIVAYDLDGDRHTEDDQIKIHGRISFTGGVDWTLKFENWQPKVVQYGLHSSSVANLRATVGSRADACTYQKTLGTVYLGQYMVMIGPMPVAFDSQLDFVLKCRVSVSGEMTFGLDLQESRRNGSTYSNGSWRNYSQSSKTVNPLVPLFSGTVRGKIEVGTHCGVRLYGVAGPYVEGFAFADLSGTVATVSGGTSLSGQLDVGGIASLGFLLRIVSHTFLDYSADWTLFRLTVWQDQRSVVDPTPPAAVMNLAAGTPTTSSVPLTWTAPGDDNNTGTATEYDIRYSTSIITVGNWASATQATGEPTPRVAGTSQSFTVTGLTADTTYWFALKTRDEVVGQWSALSNVPTRTTLQEVDPIPPAVVTNLAAGTPTTSSAPLTWTAPGDDNNTGTATEYDIRYSTSIITVGNWASATQATGEPTPQAAGTSQSFTVTGLSANTTYYFALKTRDEVVGQWSALSNVPTRTTLQEVDPIPPTVVTNLAAGTPTTSSVPLTWTAPGDDNNTGTATEYDIRYSTSIITVGNWASATQATGEPTPQVAGTSQSFTVTGLSANTTYYFALKTRDEVPNWSALSNVPMVTIPASSSAYVLVSPGTFTMGSPDGETGRASDETNHQVVLTHSFFMQEHEVTNQEFVDLLQWAKAQGHVVVTASSVTDNLGSAQELLDLDGTYCEISYNATSGLFSTAKPNYPAKEVTWYGAAAYCDWLSLKNNLAAAYSHVTWQCGGTDPYSAPGYRLPTESEWEYACRAGNTAAFSNGAITQTGCNPPDPNLLLMGWFNCNAGGGTNPVAQKTANAFGIKDMHGNMWEFCNDWYSSTYPTGPVTNPVGPSTGTLRIRRGGSWLDAASVCRSASRYWGAPPTDSARNIGFRPVRSAN